MKISGRNNIKGFARSSLRNLEKIRDYTLSDNPNKFLFLYIIKE